VINLIRTALKYLEERQL